MDKEPVLPLCGAVAIVTGGNGGIGRATCRVLAGSGARVIVVSRNRRNIDRTIAEMAELGGGQERYLGLALDVSNECDMRQMAQTVVERFGRIDVLVANAGILRASGSPVKALAQATVSEWDEVLDINLKGVFLSNRAVLPVMLKQQRGDIINVSSIRGRQGRAYDGPYSASKFGVIGMSEAIAEEVRGTGIRVQSVLPGAIATPMWRQNGFITMPTHAIPSERVADLILFMLTLPSDCMLAAPTIVPWAGV